MAYGSMFLGPTSTVQFAHNNQSLLPSALDMAVPSTTEQLMLSLTNHTKQAIAYRTGKDNEMRSLRSSFKKHRLVL